MHLDITVESGVCSALLVCIGPFLVCRIKMPNIKTTLTSDNTKVGEGMRNLGLRPQVNIEYLQQAIFIFIFCLF